MSIDSINNITMGPGASPLDPSGKGDKTSRPTPESESSDPVLGADYESTIRKAIEADQVDAQAVQQAQQELESGQLDTPENIQSAAENILKFGI